MDGTVTIRRARSRADYDACVALQREVWGLCDLDVTSAIQLIATVHAGGLLLLAESGGEAVGFCYAFAGLTGGEPHLHSDMLAVRPAARAAGVGRRLKWAQRDEALARGLRLVTWTFDPMRARNARLNLRHLGATCRDYRPDFYGRTSSALHLGLATDRLLARWELDAPRVCALAAGASPEETAKAAREANATRRTIEVPAEWDAVAKDAASAAEWQARVRVQFEEAFGAGFEAVDFDRAPDGRVYYELSCPPVAAGRAGSDDHSLHDPA
jgi:predicted GNAT superfamily acetyltransferase